MTPAQMAALHGRCFTTAPRPWTADEFAGFAADPHAILLSQPNGFGVIRTIAGEAELLTLAVDPAARRGGIGASLLHQLCDAARAAGASEMFLEVAADNHAAIALYKGARFTQVGLRRAYYAGTDAIVLRAAL